MIASMKIAATVPVPPGYATTLTMNIISNSTDHHTGNYIIYCHLIDDVT